MKNNLYWAFNVPLQIWPKHADGLDETSEVVGYTVLNYMPRKERLCSVEMHEVLGDQTREEFLESAALHLENLAKLMREAISDPRKHIYYPDIGMTK